MRRRAVPSPDLPVTSWNFFLRSASSMHCEAKRMWCRHIVCISLDDTMVPVSAYDTSALSKSLAFKMAGGVRNRRSLQASTGTGSGDETNAVAAALRNRKLAASKLAACMLAAAALRPDKRAL